MQEKQLLQIATDKIGTATIYLQSKNRPKTGRFLICAVDNKYCPQVGAPFVGALNNGTLIIK